MIAVAASATSTTSSTSSILLPVLGKIERPLPLPPSIADAVLKKKAV